MTIDDDEMARGGGRHDDDRGLLTVRLQRCRQLTLGSPVPRTKPLVGEFQKPPLQLEQLPVHTPRS